ncbi:MAG TPA: flagellar biosynthetic protein FliO [Terriglobia bacterium]|nr:flagellar biosynthetic protein FliO [Terriglobia bacterium]
MLRAIVSAFRQLAGAAKGIHKRRGKRSMRLCETLSLGDRRVLALVMVENQKLLLGTAGSSISLLARFPSLEVQPNETFGPFGSEAPSGQGSLYEADSDESFDPEEYKAWR